MTASGITLSCSSSVEEACCRSFPPSLRGGTAAAEPAAPPPAPAGPGLRPGPEIYQSIGVRPFVNARGTYTILTGSTSCRRCGRDGGRLRQYVHLDELTEAVGQRLAEVDGRGVGHGDRRVRGGAARMRPRRAWPGAIRIWHVRIPDLRGFAKDEVIIPKHSRNVYDAARSRRGRASYRGGDDVSELEAALGPRTAMVYILAGPADEGPTSVKYGLTKPAKRARRAGAGGRGGGDPLTVPNVHLQHGATLVGYSGGKCPARAAAGGPAARPQGPRAGRLGPQRAAPWLRRALKVGKEEAIGMLAAVELWVRRDHDAEWKQWTAWLEEIAERVKKVDGIGVTTEIVQPAGLSNRTPSLRIIWDREGGLTGEAVAQTLFQTEPRISLFPARGDLTRAPVCRLPPTCSRQAMRP